MALPASLLARGASALASSAPPSGASRAWAPRGLSARPRARGARFQAGARGQADTHHLARAFIARDDRKIAAHLRPRARLRRRPRPPRAGAPAKPRPARTANAPPPLAPPAPRARRARAARAWMIPPERVSLAALRPACRRARVLPGLRARLLRPGPRDLLERRRVLAAVPFHKRRIHEAAARLLGVSERPGPPAAYPVPRAQDLACRAPRQAA